MTVLNLSEFSEVNPVRLPVDIWLTSSLVCFSALSLLSDLQMPVLCLSVTPWVLRILWELELWGSEVRPVTTRIIQLRLQEKALTLRTWDPRLEFNLKLWRAQTINLKVSELVPTSWEPRISLKKTIPSLQFPTLWLESLQTMKMDWSLIETYKVKSKPEL